MNNHRISLYNELSDALQDMSYHLNDAVSEISRIRDIIENIIGEEKDIEWEES